MPRSSTAAALRSAKAQLGLLLAAFVIATLAAKGFGAEWGTASTFGQMTFAVVLVALLLRAP